LVGSRCPLANAKQHKDPLPNAHSISRETTRNASVVLRHGHIMRAKEGSAALNAILNQKWLHMF